MGSTRSRYGQGLIPIQTETLAVQQATLWDIKKQTWSTVEQLKGVRGDLARGFASGVVGCQILLKWWRWGDCHGWRWQFQSRRNQEANRGGITTSVRRSRDYKLPYGGSRFNRDR